MVSAIREGAKTIVDAVLQNAISFGDLKHKMEIQDEEFAKKLKFREIEYFNICLQYLTEKGLITSVRTNEARHLTLTADAIDFLEED